MHVLLIEDSPADARLFRFAIAKAGASAKVRHAETLAAGLAALREEPIDVIVTDLGLPDSVGLDTILRLRAARPDVPTIVFTGAVDDMLARQALSCGASDCLDKLQLDGPELVAALKTARSSIVTRPVPRHLERLVTLARRDYLEMPGLQLTAAQAARMWNVDVDRCAEVLGLLVDTKFLFDNRGRYARVATLR